MIRYEGHKTTDIEVLICLESGEEYCLYPNASQKIYNHSPDGFQWGYLGSGPAQLALALLFDTTGDKTLALRHYQDFKFEIIANLGDDWYLGRDEILEWLDSRESRILADNLCKN